MVVPYNESSSSVVYIEVGVVSQIFGFPACAVTDVKNVHGFPFDGVVDSVNVRLAAKEDSANQMLGTREIFYDLYSLGEGIKGSQCLLSLPYHL